LIIGYVVEEIIRKVEQTIMKKLEETAMLERLMTSTLPVGLQKLMMNQLLKNLKIWIHIHKERLVLRNLNPG
jgi:hypothetical protein